MNTNEARFTYLDSTHGWRIIRALESGSTQILHRPTNSAAACTDNAAESTDSAAESTDSAAESTDSAAESTEY